MLSRGVRNYVVAEICRATFRGSSNDTRDAPMPDPNPPLPSMIPDPNPPLPSIQQYFLVRLEFDSGDGRARLTLQGPKVPGLGVSPAIGVGRDAQGNYRFLIGGNTFVYPPEKLPGELLKMLGDPNSRVKGPPTPMRLPSKRQLQNSDGSWRSWDDYDRDRKLFHSPGSNLGDVWPALPPALYRALIDFYSGRTRSPINPNDIPIPPRSPTNPGDFPIPSGDSRMV